MNYTELCANIEQICETTFTPDQLAMFTKQAEKNVYNMAQLPSTQVTATATLTASDPYLQVPYDMISMLSMAVIVDGAHRYLLLKDVSFLREAYPNPTDTGVPKHYALFNEDAFMLAPTPAQAYEVSLQYYAYPESIVTAGTTYLGETYDNALLNGALVEAIRFMKGPEDLVKMYETMYAQSIAVVKNLSDGRMRSDAFQQGVTRAPVK